VCSPVLGDGSVSERLSRLDERPREQAERDGRGEHPYVIPTDPPGLVESLPHTMRIRHSVDITGGFELVVARHDIARRNDIAIVVKRAQRP
jgi:hypothetical protein